MSLILAQSENDALGDLEGAIGDIQENAPTTAGEAVDVIGRQLAELWTGFLESLPIFIIGLIVFVVTVAIAMTVARTVQRGVERAKIDRSVSGLLFRIVRLVLLGIAVLFTLSVMGVSIGSVVTVLAVLGFAIGLALQSILQNFVSGIILLIRKPFRTGDEIITGDYEGIVEDIDFRVTRILTYDGTTALIPNAMVFDNPLVNLTQRGRRRTTLTVGVDYRDDHDEARRVLAESVAAVEGVLAEPPCEALLTELADSSVTFELRYWTQPDIGSVRHTQDRVLAAAKRGLADAGMTIPWPIRTLVVDPDSAPVLAEGLRARTTDRQ